MEIPSALVGLYCHWEYHLDPPERVLKHVTSLDEHLLVNIDQLITERMHIWERKTTDQPLPWTADPILQHFRFCNIYRELDAQTIQIHTMLNPLRQDFPLWLLNLLYLRFVANPQTVKQTGLLSFDVQNNERVLQKLRELPSPKYGSAYLFPISIIQQSEYPTREQFFCIYLPRTIVQVTKSIALFKRISVIDALKVILPLFGFNFVFHWTEVLIDVAYQYPEYIDLFKRFPIGPGAKPTMQLLNNSVDPEVVCLQLVHHVPLHFPYLELRGKAVHLSTENWEGIGCEYRKYRNLQLGGGRHRLYKGG